MLRKSLIAAVLGAALFTGAVPAPVAAIPAARPGRACALLGSAGAAKFFGGPASIGHETNKKGNGPTVLNRGCSYSSGDATLAYTANVYSSVAMAKGIWNAMSKATVESTSNSVLMADDFVKIAGMPGFARIHRLIPGEGETPPAKELLYQVIVRKGATILIEEYGANDLDSTPRLYAAARTIVARM